jgi:hypothetical protein
MPLPFGKFDSTSFRFSRKYLYWTQDFNGDFMPLDGSFVAKTLDLRWDITGVSSFVSDTLELRWNINNLIADQVTLQWTILEAADLRITRSNIIVMEEGATSGERSTQVTYASIMVVTGVTDAVPGPRPGRNTIMNV